MAQTDSDYSDDEAYDLRFMHHEIKNEWDCVEHAKLKLSLLENMDTRLQLVRSLKSGEVPAYYAELYRQDFREKINGSTVMAENLQRHYDRLPKAFVLKGQERIDIFVSIDQGVTGRAIKDAATKKRWMSLSSLSTYALCLVASWKTMRK